MHHRFMWISNVRASHGTQLVNLLKSRVLSAILCWQKFGCMAMIKHICN